ncbi:methyltransferase small domain protein [Acinetobacter sp. ANC 4169]|jgi:methylase of polypeptide subunit release factors|uniref:methyltransferase n=1 Tax=Acinetobacter sp. ANC 4169 TaxID=1977879 RepID=UPI000A336B13|nr:class I SAM-dependent methyltransferase [Acinetobacter sp. ANC 4169]OTG69750.1 methyltransferase small domain protein [Acinetobacter sp. ANC 4169]
MNQILDIQTSQQQALLFLLGYLKQQNYRFTTITPLSHQRILSRNSNTQNKAITLRDIFGWNLAFAEADLEPALFAVLEEHQLIHFHEHQWRSHVRVSSLDDELFIHSSFPTLAADSVFFGPDTYRFVYHLKQYLAARPHSFKRAVELCCGTSAAAISLAKSCLDLNEVMVADLNPKALFYSQINASFSELNNITPVSSNLFAHIEGQFDLIFANPPYLIDADQRQYRHGGNELDGSELSFRILKEGIERLNPQGCLFLYTGVAIRADGNRFLEQLEKLIASQPKIHWSYKEIDPDVFGEELEQPAYQHIERIALVLVKVENIVELR